MRYDKHRTKWKDRYGDDRIRHTDNHGASKAEKRLTLPQPDTDWAARQATLEAETQEPERWDGMS